MASFRSFALYLLGIVAGFGVALACLAHLLEPGQAIGSIDSITALTAGILLLGSSLIGGMGIAGANRRWRLRTALITIALLATVLGAAAALRRRAQRYEALELQHQEQGRSLAHRSIEVHVGRSIAKSGLFGLSYDVNEFTGEAASLLRQAHRHFRMSELYHQAASRPWLPVRPGVPCDCEVCAKAAGTMAEP